VTLPVWRTPTRVVLATVGFVLLASGCDLPSPASGDPAPLPSEPPATTEPADPEPTAPATEPSDPAEPTEAETDPIEPQPADFAGLPEPGTLAWGLNTRTAERLAFHEQQADHALSLHRSFFQWRHRTTDYLLSTVEEDLAAGRLPWVSFKAPSWEAMAAGDHDAEIDELLTRLDAMDGPVWLTIHHEPEGGGGVNSPDDPGGPAAHVAMNRRVRQRMTALGTDNIALAPILMSYTWDPRSGRDPNAWFAPGIYDFVGIDHYVFSETSLLNDVWSRVRQWAGDKDLPIAVGEWGMKGSDAAAASRLQDWYDHAANSHDDGAGARVIGLSAFESHPDADPRAWFLEADVLDAFHDLLLDPRTAYITAQQ
jgi:hypothetical protein